MVKLKAFFPAVVMVSAAACPLAADERQPVTPTSPDLQKLSASMLAGDVFADSRVETLIESSDAGETEAKDLVWHESTDRCLQTGVYETGPNRYIIEEPYPHDELMMFVTGGVTLTPTAGAPVAVVAGDTVMLPKGWTGTWDSEGYRKVYVIYDCPDD